MSAQSQSSPENSTGNTVTRIVCKSFLSRRDKGDANINTSNSMKHLNTHSPQQSPHRLSNICLNTLTNAQFLISSFLEPSSAEAELQLNSPSCGGPARGGRYDSSAWTGSPPRCCLKGPIAATCCESASCSAPSSNKQGRQRELTCITSYIASLKAVHAQDHFWYQRAELSFSLKAIPHDGWSNTESFPFCPIPRCNSLFRSICLCQAVGWRKPISYRGNLPISAL